MKILITGANGFIGKNLVSELKNKNKYSILEFTRDTPIEKLEEYCKEVDFVYHLAGVNRTLNNDEYYEGSYLFTKNILDLLKKHNNKCPVMHSSSIQATLDKPYGKSKKATEDELILYEKQNDVKVLIYRFPNVFGKWCKPNYNSAIATFCYNISNNLPIQVNNRDIDLNLIYID